MARQVLDDGYDDTCAQDLAEQFEALDQWLSNGGFLPSEWQPRTDALKGTP